jgi:hypothetical protein
MYGSPREFAELLALTRLGCSVTIMHRSDETAIASA